LQDLPRPVKVFNWTTQNWPRAVSGIIISLQDFWVLYQGYKNIKYEVFESFCIKFRGSYGYLDYIKNEKITKFKIIIPH